MAHTNSKSIKVLINLKEKTIGIALHSDFKKIALSYYEISSKTIGNFS